MSYATNVELASLIQLSEQLGQDPLVTQGSAGNTSMKIDGTLWIKASGKWLANAGREDIFVPVDLAEMRETVQQARRNPSNVFPHSEGAGLRPSIETAMHAVLPYPIVVHVHAVNTIAWAIRQNARAQLCRKLAGLPWQWI